MADSNKQTAGDGQGNDDKSQTKANANSKPNGEGSQEGKKPDADTSEFVSKEEYEEAIKSRDGTISALDKKINTLEKGLKGALGIGEDEGQKTTEELLVSLQNQVNSLTQENQAAKVEKQIASVLTSYKDEKGNALSPQAQAYLQKKVSLSGVKPEEIENHVKQEIADLQSTFGNALGTQVRKANDKRPQSIGSNIGRDFSKPKNANEILESVSN